MRQELRPYQVAMIDGVRDQMRLGRRRVLVRAPTGAGKTTVMAGLAEACVQRGFPVWMLVHRDQLAKQGAARMRGQSLDAGILMGAPSTNPLAQVQVISIPTLVSRLRRVAKGHNYHRFELPPPPGPRHVVFFDEAHHAIAKGWLEVGEYCKEAFQFFFTATPWGPGGKGLGVAESFVDGPAPGELLKQGHLALWKIFAGPAPSLEDVEIARTTKDFKQADLEEKVAPLVGDVIETWKRLAPGRRTLAFAVSKAHSRMIVERFIAAGIPAEHVDDESSDAERDAIFARLADGDTLVVSNVGIVTEGFDCPAVDCVILARPTKSESLYLQMVGRGARPSPGKEYSILLDHGFNAARFGHPYLLRSVTLHGRPAREEPSEKDLDGGGDFFRVCPECLYCNTVNAKACAHCGVAFTSRPPRFDTSIDLVEYTPSENDSVEQKQRDRRGAWYALEKRFENSGKRPWAASFAYKERYGMMPHEDNIFRTRAEADYYWAARRKGASWASRQSQSKSSA